MADITVKELKERMDQGTAPKIIDVRETWEYQKDHIEAENIPMGIVPAKLPDLEPYRNEELVVTCRSGGRSGQITFFLTGQGFTNVRNLQGGMLAWKAQIDPSFNVE
ncbi:MAG: rhodanese-like domain-containing protein [Bacteroidia bacterium]|nr:rhodanese-like domain-containing protein [Bacteroidia bacterium]